MRAIIVAVLFLTLAAHGGGRLPTGSGAGPAKGLLAADEHEGIMPRPDVLRRFGITTAPAKGPGPWRLPAGAILRTREEIAVYRLRGGFFRRVTASVRQNAEPAGEVTVASEEIQSGDAIATGGVGFLRAMELTAFGGENNGHGH